MRSSLPALLVFTTIACGCLGPSALAEPPASNGPAARPPACVTPRVEIVDDAARALPSYLHDGRKFVLAAVGERYRLRIVNPTAGRVEAVVSVDGLDAIDGRPASLAKRGYLIAPFGDATIDGWRTSLDTVAAFRFSSVPASYAARTGHDRNVGVIGVAFFRERAAAVPMASKSASRAAPAPPSAATGAAPATADESRGGLGTQFGEAHDSYVTEVPFERASARPDTMTEFRYDDREGLEARGIRLFPRNARDEENATRDRAEPFPEARFAQPPR
jgi:hypothetical protein